jgi:hypothetical protein
MDTLQAFLELLEQDNICLKVGISSNYRRKLKERIRNGEFPTDKLMEQYLIKSGIRFTEERKSLFTSVKKWTI